MHDHAATPLDFLMSKLTIFNKQAHDNQAQEL
jgi:hypothetical protein